MVQKVFNLIRKPEMIFVGYKWQGTFEQVGKGEIHPIIQKMKNKVQFVQNIKEPTILYGINYHDMPNGFTHYSVIEVTTASDIQDEMISLHLPQQLYAQFHHKMGDNIGQTYEMIEKTIRENGYKPLTENSMGKNDTLPIKIELYPLASKMNKFEILIPVEKDK